MNPNRAGFPEPLLSVAQRETILQDHYSRGLRGRQGEREGEGEREREGERGREGDG